MSAVGAGESGGTREEFCALSPVRARRAVRARSAAMLSRRCVASTLRRNLADGAGVAEPAFCDGSRELGGAGANGDRGGGAGVARGEPGFNTKLTLLRTQNTFLPRIALMARI